MAQAAVRYADMDIYEESLAYTGVGTAVPQREYEQDSSAGSRSMSGRAAGPRPERTQRLRAGTTSRSPGWWASL